VEVLAQRLPQGWGVGVGGRHEAAWFQAGELQHASSRIHGASCLLCVQPHELGFAVGTECAQRLIGPTRQTADASARSHRAQVLEAVLSDRVAAALALDQPADHLGRALCKRM
jgi:hypothetical protein